jgi:hypothetical protein
MFSLALSGVAFGALAHVAAQASTVADVSGIFDVYVRRVMFTGCY